MGTKLHSDFYLLTMICLIVSFLMATVTSATTNDSDFKNFVQNVNDFESKLGKGFHDKNQNSVSSLPSVVTVLACLYHGAQGKTTSEIEAFFAFGNNQSNVLSEFKKLNSYIESPITKIANALYVDKEFTLKKDFVDATQKYFDMTVNSTDFSEKAEAAETINAWAEEKTEKLIKSLINPDDLSEDTKLVLLNAIYFKGQWKYRFDQKNTIDEDFKVSASKTIKVKQMSQKSKFPYTEDKDYKYLHMPFSNENFRMLLVLPKEIETFQNKNISKTYLSSLKFQEEPVNVRLPRFKIASTIDFASILKPKIPSLFDASANLTGIADAPLFVSMMKQKACIEVNEDGAEAAAVTYVGFELLSIHEPPSEEAKSFVVDQPFFYYVQAKGVGDTYIDVFEGTVVEPETDL